MNIQSTNTDVKKKIVLKWADRLLDFSVPALTAEELGLNVKVRSVCYGEVGCEKCGEHLVVEAETSKDHPYRAMRNAMTSASRSCRKIMKLDQRVQRETKDHIRFQFLTLTFPVALHGLSVEHAWRVFRRFWQGSKKRPGRKGKEKQSGWRSFGNRHFGAAVNLHIWKSEDPAGAPFSHFHANLAMLGVRTDGGADHLTVEFSPYLGFLGHNKVRQAWASAIEEETEFRFDRTVDLEKQLVIKLKYYSLADEDGKPRLLHNLKYSTRRWIVDLGHAAVESRDSESYLEGLTGTGRYGFSELLAAWRSKNGTRAFGWWRRLKQMIESEEELDFDGCCPVCRGPTTKGKALRLGDVDLERCEFIVVGKKGKVEKTERPPAWWRKFVERGRGP